MIEHEKWESRRAYYEAFEAKRDGYKILPNWPGTPNHCKCGCGGVWYSRGGPNNWWYTFNPGMYLSVVRDLGRLFYAFQGFLWCLPPVVRNMMRAAPVACSREAVLGRIGPDVNITMAVAGARLGVYGFLIPLLVIAWLATWSVSRPGVAITVALYPPTLAFMLVILSTAFLASIIAISMSGLVFIIGGVGSILYLDNPVIGIVAIVAGVFIQYEIQRRETMRHQERLGFLILGQRQSPQ